ncbi:hypothetical protein PanWU01x14_154390, partial [Parasponia andersonii]
KLCQSCDSILPCISTGVVKALKIITFHDVVTNVEKFAWIYKSFSGSTTPNATRYNYTFVSCAIAANIVPPQFVFKKDPSTYSTGRYIALKLRIDAPNDMKKYLKRQISSVYK